MCNKKKYHLQLSVTTLLLFTFLLAPLLNLYAQDTKTANIKLAFSNTDSTKTCKATVTSDGLPVKEIEVHLYVKRTYSDVAVGSIVKTDDNGEADINFPMDMPGDKKGMLVVIAKIEHDDNYADTETQSEVKWGVQPKHELSSWASRSLSASREKAPMFLVVVSIAIIIGIWGTILYLIFQLFRIKRSGRHLNKANISVG